MMDKDELTMNCDIYIDGYILSNKTTATKDKGLNTLEYHLKT